MEEERTRREASVLRYKEKRQTRLFSKKIRYQVRKLNADKRPRLKVNAFFPLLVSHSLVLCCISSKLLIVTTTISQYCRADLWKEFSNDWSDCKFLGERLQLLLTSSFINFFYSGSASFFMIWTLFLFQLLKWKNKFENIFFHELFYWKIEFSIF